MAGIRTESLLLMAQCKARQQASNRNRTEFRYSLQYLPLQPPKLAFAGQIPTRSSKLQDIGNAAASMQWPTAVTCANAPVLEVLHAIIPGALTDHRLGSIAGHHTSTLVHDSCVGVCSDSDVGYLEFFASRLCSRCSDVSRKRIAAYSLLLF